MTPIPLIDLDAATAEIRPEIERGFERVLSNSRFVGGEDVACFEQEFAAFCGRRFCIGVGSGTDALELLLRASGVRPGDEVIVPANSFNASAGAVARLGATPVFADVDPDSLLLDVKQAFASIGPRTRAVLPVHLYGQIAPLERLAPFAREHGLEIVEDAAQAHGATRHGVGIGSSRAGAALSFYPGKNLGAFGDAGAVVTDDPEIAEAVRMLGSHGSRARYDHVSLGFNSRLDSLQAVVLRAKLARLNAWNAARREAARRYEELLRSVDGVRLPITLDGNEHVWHLYVVRVRNRDEVLAGLHAAGIDAGVHYPKPLHRQKAFRSFHSASQCLPAVDHAAREVLSLPMHPHITPEQQERVVSVLADLVRMP
jgi:dTDP-4-amino-4,6-dideoxygalactose transaminase